MDDNERETSIGVGLIVLGAISLGLLLSSKKSQTTNNKKIKSVDKCWHRDDTLMENEGATYTAECKLAEEREKQNEAKLVNKCWRCDDPLLENEEATYGEKVCRYCYYTGTNDD